MPIATYPCVNKAAAFLTPSQIIIGMLDSITHGQKPWASPSSLMVMSFGIVT